MEVIDLNILSLDIDIFFRDCHKYQRYIDMELTGAQSWQVIEWKTKTKDYPIDFECLSFVKKILKDKCKDAETYLINEHDEIINILKQYGKYNHVTNIDYHSDISYGNDDTKPNIENWVKFGRNMDLIQDYFWICQDSSEVSPYSTFRYTRSSWKDIRVEDLPKYDVVVFCISHHFTPPNHWVIAQYLREYLHRDIKNEFVLCDEPPYDINDYPHFDGEMEVVPEAVAWYRYYDYYVLGEKIDGVVWLSIINLNSSCKKNFLTPCIKLLNRIISNYDVGFTWDKGYKTEDFILRLVSRYKVIKKYETDKKMNVIITRGNKNE